MKFAKVHGLGNDFVILNCLDDAGSIPESRYGELAVELCNRNFGIGADGIMLVQPSDKADIRMRIINSDGSEAEMCGNGIRCFARYVYEHGIVPKEAMTIETLAGIMGPRIMLDDAGAVVGIEVDMNEPILEKPDIPMVGEGRAIAETIQIEDQSFEVTAVSMGNPHCVIFVDDAKNFPISYWGPRIEKSEYFPRKTNVEFVQVLNDHEVIMRVWERGAAVTLACGTGACATTTACVLNGKTGRDILLHLDGGDLNVRWDEESNHLFMTGPAQEVFQGEYPLGDGSHE
ncbi:MAG: diaminopimelate epimerase [Peptococcaceae bacterium]|nr:diaminopimelate epimerase [Peptococcaceae bacterium]